MSSKRQREHHYKRSLESKKARKDEDKTLETSEAAEASKAKPEHRHRNYAVFIGYTGSLYHGLQKQVGPDGTESVPTVEGTLEKAMISAGWLDELIAKDPRRLSWSRAARTDKGVHAVGNVVACNLKELNEDELSDMIDKVNSVLEGSEIKVLFAHKVIARFDARLLCDRRRYEYLIPFSENDDECLPVNAIERLNEIFSVFVGTHSFHNFTSGMKSDDPSCKRHILFARVEPVAELDGRYIKLVIEGQSFLLNQIRKIVGCAVECLLDRITLEDVKSYFSPEVSRNIQMAPGEGLLLDRLYFETYDRFKCNMKDILPIDWSITHRIKDLDAFKTEFVYKEITRVMPNVFKLWIENTAYHGSA